MTKDEALVVLADLIAEDSCGLFQHKDYAVKAAEAMSIAYNKPWTVVPVKDDQFSIAPTV